MKRLDILKKELEEIKNLRCLSYNLIDKATEWYEHEIECIEKYGSANPDYPDTEEEYIKIPRGSLKYRGKDFVFYNINYLKEHWKMEEHLIMENPLTETWNGIHGQITAPAGAFDALWAEGDDDTDI